MVCPGPFAIPPNSFTPSTRGCGRITISWRPMSFKAFSILIALGCLLSGAAGACFAAADSLLADRIEAGDRQAALELIARNSPVNTSQLDGATPLHWAVYRVDEELVKALLGHGAKADVANAFG